MIKYGCFFFQAEDGIRYLVRSRGLGDVYKRQVPKMKKGSAILLLQSVPGHFAASLENSPDEVEFLSLIHI